MSGFGFSVQNEITIGDAANPYEIMHKKKTPAVVRTLRVRIMAGVRAKRNYFAFLLLISAKITATTPPANIIAATGMIGSTPV